jgi:hypothetical protein
MKMNKSASSSNYPKLSRKALKKERQRLKMTMSRAQNVPVAECTQDDGMTVNDTAPITSPTIEILNR